MAHAINKTIESGGNITDGRAIIEVVRTLQFRGKYLGDAGNAFPESFWKKNQSMVSNVTFNQTKCKPLYARKI